MGLNDDDKEGGGGRYGREGEKLAGVRERAHDLRNRIGTVKMLAAGTSSESMSKMGDTGAGSGSGSGFSSDGDLAVTVGREGSGYDDGPSSSYASEMSGDDANPNGCEQEREGIVVMGDGPGRRAGHTTTVVGRRLFVFGGSFGSDYLNDFYVLDTDPPPHVRISTKVVTGKLQEALRGFVDNEEFSDVTFLVEGKVVYGHKVILSLLSERFRAMFSCGFKESREREIPLEDIRYPVFLQMLEYIYTGVSPYLMGSSGGGGIGGGNSGPPQEEEGTGEGSGSGEGGGEGGAGGTYDAAGGIDYNFVIELMQLSDQFMLDHLKQICESILQSAITVDTVQDILSHAGATNGTQLSALCRHFARNNRIQIDGDDVDCKGGVAVNEDDIVDLDACLMPLPEQPQSPASSGGASNRK